MELDKLEVSKIMNDEINNTVLVAVKNPTNNKFRGWFYNIFLGGLKKKKVERNERKVNWIMEITEREIKILQEKTCEIIILGNNHGIITETIDTTFKEGYKAMLELFNNMMSDSVVKLKIKKLLSSNDGRPTEDYRNILRANKKLEE